MTCISAAVHVATPTHLPFPLNVRAVDTYSVVLQDYGCRKSSLASQGGFGRGGGRRSWVVKLVLVGCLGGERRYGYIHF